MFKSMCNELQNGFRFIIRVATHTSFLSNECSNLDSYNNIG